MRSMDATATAPVDVTDAAAKKIRQLAEKEGRPEPILRLRVVAGGCSGFGYQLRFEDAAAADDVIVSAPLDVRVIVDPASTPLVQGSTLDFDPALLGGGLKVRNPQAIHECACGESFSV
jgi:iron-sulfur cluster assembly protein